MISEDDMVEQIAQLDADIETVRDELISLQEKRDDLQVTLLKTYGTPENASRNGPWTIEQYEATRGVLYGGGDHYDNCDELIRLKWSGVGCTCGVRWYCL